MMILQYCLILPLLSAFLVWLSPFKLVGLIHRLCAVFTAAALLCAVLQVYKNGTLFAYGEFFALDSLGAAFLFLVSLTGVFTQLYAPTYLKWEVEDSHITPKALKTNLTLSHLAVFAMVLTCLANNIGVMWAAVEATTLATVFMVVVANDKKSLESGYKYIVICSVGLAFALFAVIFLYLAEFNALGEKSSFLFSNLVKTAAVLDENLMKIVFVFALVGFGTKAGLVPTHTWLPDAHAQGPAPTSAMLSGIVLKVAMLALIRFYALTLQASGAEFVEVLMTISGLLTIFVAAFFLIRQHDVKRMFAYHSIAHMGVAAFALGVGGAVGIMAGIFHCLAHSFTKALAFLTTGNIAHIYGTKDMRKMGGMIKVAPLTAILFGASICSLVGVPAFAIFVSEFLAFKAAILNNQLIIAALFAIGLAIIFVADFSHFFLASFGEKITPQEGEVRKVSLTQQLPLIALAALMVSFGLYHFECFWTLVERSVDLIKGF